MSVRNAGAGLILIAIGGLLLLSNLGFVDIFGFWPLLVVAVGVAFFLMWVKDRSNYGLLMPFAVLTITGLLFLYCEYEGWWRMQDLWPVFVLAPGVGFILMYALGEQDKGLLFPGTIMLATGTVFLSVNPWSGRWWPIVLIIAGIIILLGGPRAAVEAVADVFDGPDESEPTGAEVVEEEEVDGDEEDEADDEQAEDEEDRDEGAEENEDD
jgi:hypothetical protein